jgi:hypothetical protein
LAPVPDAFAGMFASRMLFESDEPPGRSPGSSLSSTRICAMLYSRDWPIADVGDSPVGGRRIISLGNAPPPTKGNDSFVAPVPAGVVAVAVQ